MPRAPWSSFYWCRLFLWILDINLQNFVRGYFSKFLVRGLYFLYWASPNNFSLLWQCLFPLSLSLCLLRAWAIVGCEVGCFFLLTSHSKIGQILRLINLISCGTQCFFTVPLPSPNRENPPRLQMAFRSLFFVSKVKKAYQWSQLGKIDPKSYQKKGVS